MLSEQSESQAMRKVAAEVAGDVRNGADLSAALESREKTFGALYISMVRAGEASGQMDQILERLADHLEEGDKLRSELRSALTPVCSSTSPRTLAQPPHQRYQVLLRKRRPVQRIKCGHVI